jgi:ubiquinone biosynthesis protein COQ9
MDHPELHQLVSPTTAFRFLDGLLDASDRVSNATEDAATFTNYIGRSWLAIARSKGLI